jgi:YggT family protein
MGLILKTRTAIIGPVLHQIISLLLDVAVGLVAGAALLRLYMQHQGIPVSARAGNPLGPFIFALTDWMVLPLRKVVPAVGRLDTASAVTVFVLELAQVMVLWALAGGKVGAAVLPVLALFACLRLVLSVVMALTLVYAILSWVQTHSAVTDVLDRLCAPLLRPLRKRLPLVGGMDLSPLALLLLAQVGTIVLDGLQRSVMR